MTGKEQVEGAVQSIVDAGQLAGAATIVWRDGQVVQHAAVGWRNVEERVPMSRDTIFRIASLTKAITSVAALMLVDEGRIKLDDPIARWAPEFSAMRVLREANGPLEETDAAQRAITFADLLTHRSGLTYGGFHRGPLAKAYEEALGRDIDSHVTPDDWIANLASLPLIDQPGAAFHYGASTDLLGFLLARIEGASLGEVLARRIFRPLGMVDTGFIVPASKRARRAAMYGFDEAGRLTHRVTATGSSTLPERPDDLAYESGGAGLWSTLDDYLTFARVFVSEGMVDGVRLLRPDTLAMMMTNQLSNAQRASSTMFGMRLFAMGHGYGMGVAVVLEPEQADPIRCGGGRGAVGWPGAWGGWWQADPNDRSVMIFLAHNLVELHQFAKGIGLGVYDAITKFQSLSSTTTVAR
jgi:CubicO group peptidase (beta-lactamase class C family)